MTTPTSATTSTPPPGAREHPRPRLAASSCLLGAPVRYNGGHSRDRFLTGSLSRHVDWIPVCPEMEIGLGSPRPTMRLRTDGHIVTKDETDHTDAMHSLADRRIPALDDLDGYVLKARSPTCGLFNLPRYASGRPGERTDGQPVDRTGLGVFAARIRAALPDLPTEEDGRLNDPVLREHFVERVFAHARLRELFSSDWRPRDLVDFHSRHKMQLLAHSPGGYRETGRIVAHVGDRPRADLEADYRRAFAATLAVRAGRGRHTNALQHLLGFIGDDLDATRRHDILTAIGSYREGRAPLSVPIALLRHHAEGEHDRYVADQTYLEPFPDDLALRHHV
ncbi:YbgA family protein [Actinomadura sediminis]|uniref:YbgA family protein n=1 Tax=Actinomadura sediminis TaxID=1038904 RepID=A0ABW3EUI4_9ACTN